MCDDYVPSWSEKRGQSAATMTCAMRFGMSLLICSIGVNPNAVGKDGERILYYAFRSGHVAQLVGLLKAGTDPNQKDKRQRRKNGVTSCPLAWIKGPRLVTASVRRYPREVQQGLKLRTRVAVILDHGIQDTPLVALCLLGG